MKNNDLIQDALQLAKSISDTSAPTKEWIIVNIAKDVAKQSLQPFLHYISAVYFYRYDDVPQLLEQEGVIEQKVENKWFQKVVQYSKLQKEYSTQVMYDHISSYARSKGYFVQGQKATYFDNRSGHLEDYGPQLNGQYAILVNKQKLADYINWYSGLQPKFNIKTGVFEFLGESVQIDGDIEQKSFDLLFKNLNSIVSKKEFYEVRGRQDYDIIYKQTGITKLHDTLEKVFLKLKDRIHANDKLRKAIKFTQQDGFGIFINERALIKSPKTPQY